MRKLRNTREGKKINGNDRSDIRSCFQQLNKI